MKPNVAVRNDALTSPMNTLCVISETAVPIAIKPITIMPSGSTWRARTQTRTLLTTGESPPA
jgi:hypothetical protein